MTVIQFPAYHLQLDQGGIFALLFVFLIVATQMPAQEYRMGSVPFLLHLLTIGTLINVIYVCTAVSNSRQHVVAPVCRLFCHVMWCRPRRLLV